MQHSFSTLLRDGQDYMKLWPEAKELGSYFAEPRVIAATKFGLKVMPALAVVSTTLMVQVNGSTYLPQALAIGGFFLSLPFQGVLWLGHRSNQVLPPALRHWYRDIHAKMAAHGCSLKAAKAYPKYRELAELLKTAFSELDRVFRKDLLSQ
ncbi:DUF412 domain-containing protein [Alteromonas sediminis]|uniref:UPF0208 membrane protein YfbV n=1 Tax=Alteromonas sediminis TaxID=2259342 RepID=A0A3N5YQZ6_9ALTE|nr:terminus macrodomain insulation protein YfbV [Alteromonas sediminis]RPJ68741.1 DUF412 domain-containing protein [Alteromonas sediminis]